LLLVRAERPGFVPDQEAVQVPQERSVEVLLALRRGMTIRGRVRSKAGKMLPGVQVVAIPRGLPFDAPSGGVYVRGRRPWARTIAADDGSFRITVPRDLEMRLRAQSAGWAQEKPLWVGPLPDAREDAEEAVLVMRPTRLLRLHLVDAESGQPIWMPFVSIRPNDPRVGYPGRGTGRILMGRYFDGRAWRIAMGPPAADEDLAGVYEGVLSGETEEAIPSRIRVTIDNVLGYVPTMVDVTLQRPGAHDGYDEVRLRRTDPGAGVGTLVVRETLRAQQVIAAARVLRVSVADKWKWRFIRGSQRSDQAWVFHNVPAGRHDARIMAGSKYWSYPFTVAIAAGGSTSATVTFPDPVGIRIHAEDDRGAPVLGFGFSLRRASPDGSDTMQLYDIFHGGGNLGYDMGRVVTLEPGRYEIMVHGPVGYESFREVFTLATGEIRIVDAVLRRKHP